MTSIAALSLTSALTMPGVPGLATAGDPAAPGATFLDLMTPTLPGTIDVAPRPEVAAPGKSLPQPAAGGEDALAWLATVDAPAAALTAVVPAAATLPATGLVVPAPVPGREDASIEEAPALEMLPTREAKGKKAETTPDVPLPCKLRPMPPVAKPRDAKGTTSTVTGSAEVESADVEPDGQATPAIVPFVPSATPPVAATPLTPPPVSADVPAPVAKDGAAPVAAAAVAIAPSPRALPAEAAPAAAVPPVATPTVGAVPATSVPPAPVGAPLPSYVATADVAIVPDAPASAPPILADTPRRRTSDAPRPAAAAVATAPIAAAPAAVTPAPATVEAAAVVAAPTLAPVIAPRPAVRVARTTAPASSAPAPLVARPVAPTPLPVAPIVTAPPAAAASPATPIVRADQASVPASPLTPVAADAAPVTAPVAASEPARAVAAPTPAPVAARHVPLPLPVAPRIESAARTFADAIHRAVVAEAPDPTLAAPVQQVAATPLTIPAQHAAPLDMTHAQWPAKMIERIEALREMVPDVWADQGEASIRLIPDALGTIDVALKRDGDTVQVQMKAEQPQTRQLLAEAAPKLTELAEQRGLKLHQASPDAAFGGNAAGQQAPNRQQAQQQQAQQQPASLTPRRAAADPAPSDDDARVA